MLDGMSEKMLPEMLDAHVVGSTPSKKGRQPSPNREGAGGSHNLLFGDFQTHHTGMVKHSEFSEILGDLVTISSDFERKWKQCTVFRIMLSEIKERNIPQNKWGEGMVSEETWLSMECVLCGILTSLKNETLLTSEARFKKTAMKRMLHNIHHGREGISNNTYEGMVDVLTQIIDSIMAEDRAQPELLSKTSEEPSPPTGTMVLSDEPIVITKHRRVKNNCRIPVIQEIVSECKVKFPNATDTVANRKAIHRFGSQFCEHHGMRTQHIRVHMPLVVELVLTPDKWEVEAQTAAGSRFIRTRRGAWLSLWHHLLNYVEGVGHSAPVLEN